MLHKHRKHLSGRHKKSTHQFICLLFFWVYFLPQVDGYFMSDAKAVLQGCDDHWTFQGQGHFPVLFQTTVCVDVQILSPGEWTAFSYISAPAPRYELALQGDETSLYAWLLGVRHQFPVQLTLRQWYRLCLRWDAPRKSFSLTIAGNPEVYQRTAIARAIPPSGRLLLGCQPKDASPGVKVATVELYLFRIWDDVGEHKACEDGAVVGWDSRLWDITRAQARIQDFKLQCGHLRKKRSADGKAIPPTQLGVSAVRDLRLTTPNRLVTTLASILQNILQGESPIPSSSHSTLNTTSAASPQTLTGSAGNTAPHIGGLSSSIKPISSSSYVTTQLAHSTSVNSFSMSSDFTHAAPTAITSAANPTAVIQTTTSYALFTEPFEVQCNFSQYCANESSYYWMAVEVYGSNVTEKNIQTWFSDLFSKSSCPTVNGALSSSSATFASSLGNSASVNTTSCQDGMVLLNSEVRCEDKQNIQRNNCTVLLQLNQSVSVCMLRGLVENGTGNTSIQIQLLGDVERVGKGLCVDQVMSPSGHDFVQCMSSMSYYDICQTPGPINVTCSYTERSQPVYSQCNVNSQQRCECHVSTNNETNYAVRLNIMSQKVNFTYIQNRVLQLDTPCDQSSISGSLCNSTSGVSQFYQGMHLECYGEETRLHNCILALQFSRQMDICSVSLALEVLYRNTGITFDGPLTRIAVCRLPDDSETILLNSTFKWVSSNLGASQISEMQDQLKCEQGQTLGVFLNEQCATYPETITPSKTDSPQTNKTNAVVTPTSPVVTPRNTSDPPLSSSVLTRSPNNSTVNQTNTLSLNTTNTSLPVIPTGRPSTAAFTLRTTAALENTPVIPLNTTVTPLNRTTVTPLNVTNPTATTLNRITVAPLNGTNSTVTPLNGTTVTPFNRTTPTATTLNRITVAPLNTPNSTVTPLNGTTVTPLNRTTPTATTLNRITVAPLNITNSTVTPLNGTTVTPLNRTTPTATTLNRITVAPLNTPNSTVTPLNGTTVTPLNRTTPTATTLTITNSTVTPLNGTTVTPLNRTTPTATTLNRITVAPLNTPNSTVTPLNGTTVTPLNRTTPTATTLTITNSTVTPLNGTTVTPLNRTTPTATTLNGTTVTPLNITNPTITTLNGTTTTFNRTTFAQLNRTTVTPLNRTNPTVTPLNTTATTVHVTGTNVNITITPPHVTPPPINTTITPLNTTLNATDALINTTVISHNTTTTTLNTTSLPFNATVTTPYVVATVMPFNITQLNSTTIRPLNTTQTPLNLTVTASNIVKNATQSNTTDSQHVITEFKTTAFPPNATLFNFTNPSPTTSNTTKLTTPSTTQLSTIGLGNTTRFNITSPSHYNATTLLQNSTQFSGLTTPFTPTEPVNATLLNRTTLPFTINKNTTSLNVSSFVFNTTTQFPSTTQYNLTTPLKNVTTFYTMEPSNSTAQTNITTLPVNPRDTNITQPFHNTTEFSTAYPYNITQPVNSTLNTTYDKMNTTKLTTITPQFNTTQFNTTQFNTTQFNTTQFKTTQFNTTMYTLNFTILNATTVATPVINTTQFNTSITMQFYTTIGPAMKNITSAPTVSFNSTTQFNNTSEKMFTGDAAFNTTTKTNPIHTAQNKTTDSSIIEIVSNNSTASTPAVSGINTASPQNSSTSNTALQTTQATSGENTTTTTAKTVVPPGAATTSITIATTAETTTKSADAVATDLLNRTNDVSSLNSSQLNDLVNQLENLLAGPNVSLELGRTMLSVINNLLNGSASALAGSSNRLIKTVDTLGLKLVVQDKTESIAFESLTLAVTKVDGNNFVGTSFSMANPLKPQIKGGQAVRNTRAVESSSSLGQITLPASLTENLSAEEKKLASRVQFTFFQKSTFFQDKSLSQQSLNSYILGSSVANLSIKNLRENVEFTLKNTQPVAGNYVASCVFWDFNLNGGSGGWNPSGCVVKNSSTENETVCSCNHLTSFAVLLDISRQGITDRLQATILTFITYIGCGVSAIFLSITLLTYLAFDKIRRDIPSKILIHLCFGLLFLNLVFLLDSWLALYPNAVGLCISTAFFLHYFLLVSFTWMGLEALHMYLAIVKVFNNYMSRYMLKFSLAGWGVPLIVVIIVIAISKDNYGLISYGRYSDGTTDEFCWLKNDIAFYVAVVAYFGVIFLLNLAMFVVVMVHLRRIKRQNPHNSQYRSGLHDLRSIAGLTFLLGLTWGFAFFAWGPVNIAFMYLFAIFNSLQGFFIFVFHCALKENVRKQWRTYLCCGKLRLAENSEWSRTATQSNNTKKTSILTARSSLGAASIPRSSVSSDASIPSSGIGSPIDDSLIMSEEMNDDVVQNDINNLRSRFRSF